MQHYTPFFKKKAPIMRTAAGKYYLPSFSWQIRLDISRNHLQADDSHEISGLFWVLIQYKQCNFENAADRCKFLSRLKGLKDVMRNEIKMLMKKKLQIKPPLDLI